MKAELLIRATCRAQSLDNLTYTGRKDKKITAQGKETYSQTEKLDISTIQGALGLCRLPPLISNLLYAKYQNVYSPDLESQVSQVVSVRWRGPPLDVQRATKLILADVLSHHVCTTCDGSGKRMTTDPKKGVVGKIDNCGACKGTGKRALSENARAQYLKIHHETWKRKYSAPYSQIQYIINCLLNKGETRFERAMA